MDIPKDYVPPLQPEPVKEFVMTTNAKPPVTRSEPIPKLEAFNKMIEIVRTQAGDDRKTLIRAVSAFFGVGE